MAVENRYEFLKKLGVGFDQLFDVVDGLGTAYFTEDYPPYNIVKTDGETIVIQVSMTGYDRSHVTAAHQKNVLTVKAKAQTKTPDEADDVYFHHGIKDGDNYIKFPIASHLRFEGSIFDNGQMIDFRNGVTKEMVKQLYGEFGLAPGNEADKKFNQEAGYY